MNDVATTGASQLPAGLMKDMEADAAEHRQDFGADQLIIPRIVMLQDLSPQVKERNSEYVPGAQPGMIFNNVTSSLDKEITFYPARFFVRYIAWEEERGGLVDPDLTKEDVEANFDENGIGQWTGLLIPKGKQDAKRVDVIETPEWIGLASGEGWGPMPVCISFPVTKSKSARKINTSINLTEVQGKKGPFIPPAFYHHFKLTPVLETSDKNEWFGWHVHHLGLNDDAAIVAKAKELKIAFDEDKAVVSDDGASKS